MEEYRDVAEESAIPLQESEKRLNLNELKGIGKGSVWKMRNLLGVTGIGEELLKNFENFEIHYN